jgi:hypothetical protein
MRFRHLAGRSSERPTLLHRKEATHRKLLSGNMVMQLIALDGT